MLVRAVVLSAALLACSTTLLAQAPATAAAPAAQPAAKVEKPKLYDEQADAKQQIAAAVAKARKENRRVLVQWGGNWCGWCIKLHESCKADPAVSRTLLYEYDVVHIDAGRDKKNMDLAESYGAKIDGFPFLTILDSEGKTVVHQNTPPFEKDGSDIKAGYDLAKFNEFLQKHKAAPKDAESVLADALAAAKKDGKIVLLHFGAPWCGWCHKMEDWMARPEVESILTKQFVDVKIDVDRMTNGTAVKNRFTGGKEGGIPWFAFVDANGKAVATSDKNGKNVGFPYQEEEVAHFESMLRAAASKLTDDDIKALTTSLAGVRAADEKKKAPKQ